MFRVLQCHNCETFQVHMFRKNAKWGCKICGEKQSVKKIYAVESAGNCREIVQNLNKNRLTEQNVTDATPVASSESDSFPDKRVKRRKIDVGSIENIKGFQAKTATGTKWGEFLTAPSMDDTRAACANTVKESAGNSKNLNAPELINNGANNRSEPISIFDDATDLDEILRL